MAASVCREGRKKSGCAGGLVKKTEGDKVLFSSPCAPFATMPSRNYAKKVTNPAKSAFPNDICR